LQPYKEKLKQTIRKARFRTVSHGLTGVSGNTSAGKGIMDISFSLDPYNTLVVRLGGDWNIAHGPPSAEDLEKKIASTPHLAKVALDGCGLGAWDSSLLTFLIKLKHLCSQRSIILACESLPKGAVRLLDLASAVPEEKDAHKKSGRAPFVSRVGEATLEAVKSTGEMLAFLGEAFLAFVKLLRGKAQFRRCDLTLLIQECGARALPIVSLVSVLVGLILAFVGAVQLKLFGAQIYVADLVGIGMAREMGAMMTAIVMAGRTGAAFAAQLGTMEVNEEIDALKTLGISPMEFLVLPRMLALVLMLPLLCLYADLMGILGGGIIGVGILNLSPVQYFNETVAALNLTQFVLGLIKAGVFGVLVALSGCLRGMQCGRSASAVGDAATSAVVTALVSIIVSDALLTVIFDRIGV
jgi:phospholipid/cholesterol/gamma-HCH transport system permease protein